MEAVTRDSPISPVQLAIVRSLKVYTFIFTVDDPSLNLVPDWMVELLGLSNGSPSRGALGGHNNSSSDRHTMERERGYTVPSPYPPLPPVESYVSSPARANTSPSSHIDRHSGVVTPPSHVTYAAGVGVLSPSPRANRSVSVSQAQSGQENRRSISPGRTSALVNDDTAPPVEVNRTHVV